DRFMWAIVQELIFAAELEVAETIRRPPFTWIQRGKSLSDFDPQLRRNAFGISTEIPVARVPPSPGVLIVLTVGSESSSATKGSSVDSVAGKNRAPAKP
ncbi:MAG TPA: hypothetical protein VIH43_08330, partial [Chthoniobacterales bacterium]